MYSMHSLIEERSREQDKYFHNGFAFFFHSFKYQVIIFFNVFVNMRCFNA